jgi:hypothetical protein
MDLVGALVGVAGEDEGVVAAVDAAGLGSSARVRRASPAGAPRVSVARTAAVATNFIVVRMFPANGRPYPSHGYRPAQCAPWS